MHNHLLNYSEDLPIPFAAPPKKFLLYPRTLMHEVVLNRKHTEIANKSDAGYIWVWIVGKPPDLGGPQGHKGIEKWENLKWENGTDGTVRMPGLC
jgi:hypothetical protein